jgi:hypothetical protein
MGRGCADYMCGVEKHRRKSRILRSIITLLSQAIRDFLLTRYFLSCPLLLQSRKRHREGEQRVAR